MKILKNNKGFTLIELVLIIVVIGILSGVAILEFRDLRSDAQAAGNMAYIGALRSAISLRFAEQLIREGNTGSDPDVIGSTAAEAPATTGDVVGMVSSGMPDTLIQTADAACDVATATWTGYAPGNPPASSTWTLTCGDSASDPVYIAGEGA